MIPTHRTLLTSIRHGVFVLACCLLAGCVNVHVHFPEMPREPGSATQPTDKTP